jgi:dihydrofolate reductase
VVSEKAADVVRALKREPGKDIWLCGGADLARTLFEEELIDELIVKLNPRLFGAGIPLVAGGARRLSLDLRDAKVYPSGVLLIAYRVRY